VLQTQNDAAQPLGCEHAHEPLSLLRNLCSFIHNRWLSHENFCPRSLMKNLLVDSACQKSAIHSQNLARHETRRVRG